MPKRTNAFQRLVTLLHMTLDGHTNVEESAMMLDKVTGEKREIDILITTPAKKIGVEVRDRKRRAGTPWIEEMRAKHDDIETDNLILVSRSGFAKPAIKKARFYNIETLTIEEACETDWPVAMLGSQSMLTDLELQYDCFVVCEFGDGNRELFAAHRDTSFSLGEISFTIDEIVRHVMSQQDFRDAVYSKTDGVHEFSFPLSGLGFPPCQIEYNGRSGYVQDIRVRLRISTHKTIVQNKLAKFQQIPFIEATSSSSTNPLQVVILKTPEGDRGCIVDENGTRTRALWPFKDSSSTHPSSV